MNTVHKKVIKKKKKVGSVQFLLFQFYKGVFYADTIFFFASRSINSSRQVTLGFRCLSQESPNRRALSWLIIHSRMQVGSRVFIKKEGFLVLGLNLTWLAKGKLFLSSFQGISPLPVPHS